MKNLEPFWYEVSPYLFFLIGITAISGSSRMGTAFGALLLVLALLIIKMRWSYRGGGPLGTSKAARRNPRRVAVPVNTRSRYRSGGQHAREERQDGLL